MTPADKLIASDVRTRFARLVLRPDRRFDLAEAALLVAAEEDPRCDVARCFAQLDELGIEARARLESERGASKVAAFNQYMFDNLDFIGNRQDYYDPRNSLLNHVLRRHTGIPITLSIVYIEVGWRAGLRTEGVGLPGHFIVRVRPDEESDEAMLVDPFNRAVIDEEDCQERLDVVYNGQVPLTANHMQAATPREIVIRLLRNLKAVYAQAHLHRRALAAVERILLLAPQALDEHRDRGALLAHLGRYAEAITDLRTYLNFSPDATDAEAVREQLKRVHAHLAALN